MASGEEDPHNSLCELSSLSVKKPRPPNVIFHTKPGKP